ncbi:hypothetical protein HDU78_006744 [Chytriomyces hyalinus]|nr:hypothetical protein HDU78_006744 [Chytriomyces hyalinus]
MELTSVTRQYLQAVPMRCFNWDQLLEQIPGRSMMGQLSPSIQEAIMEASVHHPRAIQYPPPAAYKLQFLKYVVSQIVNQKPSAGQQEDHECIDTLLEEYMTSMSARSSSTTETCYRSYLISNDNSSCDQDTSSTQHDYITLEEQPQTISQGTTGLRTWPAALTLLMHLKIAPSEICGKRVLELGCGVGLVGIACALFGAAHVTLTDTAPSVLEAAERNCRTNGIHILPNGVTLSTAPKPIANVVALDWETIANKELSDLVESVQADVIVASDVAYDPIIVPPLVRMLTAFVTRSVEPGIQTVEALIATTRRSETTWQLFLSELQKSGLVYEFVDVAPDVNGCYYLDEGGRIDVMRIRAASYHKSNKAE